MTKVCICQICTCGRHRCPHHPKAAVAQTGTACMVTEYATRFTPKQGEMAPSFKPSQEPYRSSGPMAKDTTNRMDYIKHPLEKRAFKNPEVYKKPVGEMEGVTSYKNEYIEKPLAPTKAFKPDYSRKVSGRFGGVPTYQEDYRRWTPQPTQRFKKDNEYRPPTAPFVGESGYTSEFNRKTQPVRASMKPAEGAKMSDQPFNDGTSYKIDYPKKPLPPRDMREKPVYKINKEPLDGLSSYMKEFIPKEGVKLPSCKPDNTQIRSDAPFHDETTQKLDYQKWPMEKPYVRVQNAYVKPMGDMEKETTTHLDYNKKPLEPHPPARPMERKAAPGKFFSDTTHNLDFKRWSPIQNNRVKKSSEYVAPDAPFEGKSNYNADYTKKAGGPRASMKPAEAAKMSDAPFDGTTAYNQDYIKKAMPARELKEKAQWMPNRMPFEGKTNYTDDFIPKKGEQLRNFKPDHVPQRADVPFEGHTTNKVDYKAWQPEKPYVHQREAYQPPQGEFLDTTTHNTDYTRKPIEPVKMVRPLVHKRDAGKFDGNTTYGGDFIKKSVSAQKVEKKSDYRPPSAPFQGSSNYNEHFIKQPAAMRMSLKPAETAIGSDAKFEGVTMYNTDYYKKAVPLCPAINLDTTTSKYIFQEQQSSGHKFYQKLATPPV